MCPLLSSRGMNSEIIIISLLTWIGLVILLTFHEFGHAWMAMKCGDNTARDRGRVSLNPLVHIDLLGTVIIPLAALLLSASGSAIGGFLIGWAKPVPVNPHNLRNPRLDDLLVTLAGPWMNLLLAVVLMAMARTAMAWELGSAVDVCQQMARLSLVLFFFNMIPIPPLDGSQVVRVLTNMSYETYARIAQWGILILIVVLQIPAVSGTLRAVTNGAFGIIAGWMGMR